MAKIGFYMCLGVFLAYCYKFDIWGYYRATMRQSKATGTSGSISKIKVDSIECFRSVLMYGVDPGGYF